MLILLYVIVPNMNNVAKYITYSEVRSHHLEEP